ncbi:N-carbamoyl-L-amino-acid hydrolase [Stella humosa]|uniref:N-carbamoyl-L-amino-acid hydrolase n=1 Tax=Stella humosa TaxID=94 RepID=A0A3N1MC81_9PROT|nr:hydantoinase/carbamoylase family amidase [Stella humosa]ROQ00360.1 N-carbamoyl-L-amino-acid hydrolase [Stella humosa]BBK30401.1 Zn-dependent hydrolase [Stella humosa]
MTTFGQVAAAIDERRLWDRHEALARVGATERGGVNRQALSDEEIAAKRVLIGWAGALGLEASTDAIGNLFLRLPGYDPALTPVMTGSHIDSQPTGGKYDGVYGVLAGLEAVEAMRAAGYQPRRAIDIVAWTNEEGSRFAPGMMGSEAFAGVRALETILPVADAAGIRVEAELARLDAAFPDMARRPVGFPVAAYVEAHIEQGPELEAAGHQVGVVTGIQGKKTWKVSVRGEEAHAGTTPRRRRRDALAAAAAMIAALHRAIVDADDVVRFTVGRIQVEPNAPSVVPARADFSIDLRHPDGPTLEGFGAAVESICQANAGPCTVTVTPLVDAAPLTFPSAMQDATRQTAERLGLAPMALASAAGHDARNLHMVCPSAMIFVPCAGGISHNEVEATLPGDLAAGARVLAELLVQLADRA